MGKKGKKATDPLNYEYVTDEDTDDEYFSATDGEDSEGRVKPLRITMYCRYTHYEVVKEAGKTFCEFHLTKKEKSDWDIAWFDRPISLDFVREMKLNQRCNHIPGIYNLAKKNFLGRHLTKLARHLPSHFSFFPRTWMLPNDFREFQEHLREQKTVSTYIVKPEDQC